MKESHEPPSRSFLDRVLAAYPLLLAYVVLLLLYGWQTTKHSTPWNFTDELKWAMLSRTLAQTGHAMLQGAPWSVSSLYTFMLAPAWWAGATSTSYAIAKYLNAIVMTAALFPAYGFGRLFLPRPAALLGGILTAAIPALAYTGILIPESLAYFWSTLALYLLARALVRPSMGSIALAAVFVATAPLVKAQLRVVVLTAGIAVILALLWSDRGRRVRATWSRGDRVGAFVLAVGAVIFVDVYFAQHSYDWYIGTHFWHRAWTYGLWAAGAFTIGLGVVPVVLAVTWALRTRIEDTREAPLLAVFAASIISFALYTGVKASYESTIFSIRVWERNLIYLAPVVFVASLRYVVAGRLRPVSLLVSLALTGYLLATTPYHAYEHFYSDAPGLAILQWLNRTWAFTITDLERLLFGILALSAVIALASTLGRKSPRRAVQIASFAVIGAAAIAAVTWNLTGEIAAANASNSFSKSIVALPQPPDWIDRSTGRQRTVFVGQQISNSNFFWSTEFWNQSIRDIWTTDGSSPGLGPSVTPNFADPDGEVAAPRLSNRWGVAPGDVTLAGRVADRAGDLTLYELAQPIRVKSFIGGVYPDGWMSGQSSFVRFGRPEDPAGRLVVTLSRQAACGAIPPARLKIRVARLLINKDSQPVAGRLQSERSVVVRSNPCQRAVVRLRAKPPFRVDVTGTGFFKPADGRSLSVQVGYDYKP